MKLMPKQIEQMVADYRSGAYSFASLASKYKISASGARDLVRGVDPDFKRSAPKLPPETEDEIVLKYQAGASYRTLSEEYKATVHMIQAAVRRRGLERVAQTLSEEVEVAIVEDFRAGGFSYRKLAEKHGVSESIVQRVIRNRAPELLSKVKAVGGIKPSFDRYAAYRDYCSGRYSLAGLGHKYDVTREVMRNALLRVDPTATERMREARAKGASSIKPIKRPG